MRVNVGVMKATRRISNQKRWERDRGIPSKMTFKNAKSITQNKFISDIKKQIMYKELIKKESKKIPKK